MGMFEALKDNAALKALSKTLHKVHEEEVAKRHEECEERKEFIRTHKCCANCKYMKAEDRCFALIVYCGLYGHDIVFDDSVCSQFEWKPGKEPKQEDNSMSLEFDSFGHANVKENINESTK